MCVYIQRTHRHPRSAFSLIELIIHTRKKFDGEELSSLPIALPGHKIQCRVISTQRYSTNTNTDPQRDTFCYVTLRPVHWITRAQAAAVVVI